MSEKCKSCGDNGWEWVGSGVTLPCRECYWKKLLAQYNAHQSGWSCPRCTRIYGPTVQICVPCNTKVAQKENA